MALTDMIVGKSRGSVKQAYEYAVKAGAHDLTFVLSYLNELWRLCQLVGFDFSILVAQSINETDSWRSANWKKYKNPAGLAITNSENKSVVYQSGIDAARAHVVHMWVYVHGALKPGDALYEWRHLDGHYQEAVDGTNLKSYGGDGKPFARSVDNIEDFNVNGRWALLDRKNTPTGPLNDYGNRIVRDSKKVWPNGLKVEDPIITIPTNPGLPSTVDLSRDPRYLTTGRVPHPTVDIRDISKPDVQSGYGYDRVQSRRGRIKGCCWHEWMGRMTVEQALRFFGPGGERYGNALVDYTIFPDGILIRMNDPEGTRSPWASGGGVESGGLEGDGIFFYAKFGLGAINSQLISTEIMKLDSEDYTPAQIEMAAQLAAHWHDKDGQFWFEHPYTSKYGGVMSFLHFEFGTTTCGLGELDDLTKVQARTREIMKSWQYTGAPSQPGEVDPPDVPTLPDIVLPGNISLDKARERFGKLRKIDSKKGSVAGLIATYEFDPKGVISLGWAQKCAEVFKDDFDKWPAAGDWIVIGEPVDKNVNDFIYFDRWDQNMIRKSEKQGFVWV